MNRNIALALVVATAAAGNAFADEYTPTASFQGSLTRSEVIAEMNAFRAEGNNPWKKSYDPLAQFRSEGSRADATAAYLAERAAVAAMGGEDSGAVYLARREMARPVASYVATTE